MIEISRLESIFSIYQPASELSRWRSGALDGPVSVELNSLLTLGLEWWERSDGVFNPLVGTLTDRWRRAEAEQIVPSPDELADLVGSIGELSYAVDVDGPRPTRDCSALNFNALAKGLLIDLAVDAVTADYDLRTLVVNIGGDLLHRGEGASAVHVEDPRRPYDNASPVDTVHISNAGLATSGLTKRGVRIAGRWFSHVIDPRNGWPVDQIASASVICPSAAIADVVATIASVLPPTDSLNVIASLPDPCGCLVVTPDGSAMTNHVWDAARPQPSRGPLAD